ncbi:MAG: NAD(P)H-binding protein [Terracidiphilus sp.]
MKIIIFGATGMVGQGVLRACLAAEDVDKVLLVGRSPLNLRHSKLDQAVLVDLFDIQTIRERLSGFDACFFCLGVSSSGMTEAQYTHITFDLTMTVASCLAGLNPAMVFTYVSGAGTDSSERGRTMWARVKGRTENQLKTLGFRGVYLFRPNIIQALDGIRSKTRAFRLFYLASGWALPAIRRFFPGSIVTTDDVGQAMLNVARSGAGRAVLEPRDIARAAKGLQAC